jgi:hypothetical protein
VTVSLTANDGLSGVASTYYKVDSGLEQNGTSVTIGAEGDHTIEFWSVDNAGNVEDPPTSADQTIKLIGKNAVRNWFKY